MCSQILRGLVLFKSGTCGVHPHKFIYTVQYIIYSAFREPELCSRGARGAVDLPLVTAALY